MGGNCAGARKQLDECSKTSSYYYANYKVEAAKKYETFRKDLKDKYEEKQYKNKKAALEKQIANQKSIENLDKRNRYKNEFQSICLKLEKQFPFQQLEFVEFERRLKKLVYDEEYINVYTIIESFRSCKGFEDIDNSSSLSLSLFTSQFLKKDNQGEVIGKQASQMS